MLRSLEECRSCSAVTCPSSNQGSISFILSPSIISQGRGHHRGCVATREAKLVPAVIVPKIHDTSSSHVGATTKYVGWRCLSRHLSTMRHIQRVFRLLLCLIKEIVVLNFLSETL